MLSSVRNFLNTHIGASSQDYQRSGPSSGQITAGAAIGGGLLGMGVGAAIGASRQAADVVTVEQVPYPESYREAVGTRTSMGCFEYHYNFGSGEYEYGYNPLCVETVTDYETRYTGRTLYKEVHHHSVGFPNTMLQGALVGLGLGVATGVAGAVLYNALKK
jgi:hypothetical protein